MLKKVKEVAGQDVGEYAVLLAVMTIVAIGALKLIGIQSAEIISRIGSAIQ